MGKLSARATHIDFNEKHETRYCVDDWLRDEQIKINCARTPKRFMAEVETIGAPIAIVAFGPSLKREWEKLRDFNFIMTCSGSHRFLIDRGIIPTWHAEVDPREHKIELLGEPHANVSYLPCSAVHPRYIDRLLEVTQDVHLWHSFVSEPEALRVLPPGDWATCGGQDIGQRCLVLARLMGFLNLHCFGFDGSFDEEGSHAAAHPKWKGKKGFACEYPEGSGRFYQTTPTMLECAKRMPHELDQLKDVKTTFYGDGLTQAIVRAHTPNLPAESVIAMAKPAVISEEYRSLNAELHRTNPYYGSGGGKLKDPVLALAKALNTTSILDYGCGKGLLQNAIPFPIWEYDPAILGKQESPRPADIVVCSDVLEHIEPEYLDGVLADLKRCVRKVGYFVIHTGPAKKVLADGRNTHLIQRPREWWEPKLAEFFDIGRVTERLPELHFVLGKKQKKVKPKPASELAPPAPVEEWTRQIGQHQVMSRFAW